MAAALFIYQLIQRQTEKVRLTHFLSTRWRIRHCYRYRHVGIWSARRVHVIHVIPFSPVLMGLGIPVTVSAVPLTIGVVLPTAHAVIGPYRMIVRDTYRMVVWNTYCTRYSTRRMQYGYPKGGLGRSAHRSCSWEARRGPRGLNCIRRRDARNLTSVHAPSAQLTWDSRRGN